MYERILVPTDGSQQARRAVERAVDLAKTYDAELHVLFVVDTTRFGAEVDATFVIGKLERAGEQIVEETVAQATEAGVSDATGVVEFGPIHGVILDYADDHDVDLVVMGTHGRRGVDRYLFGSVTEKVVRRSDVPVLTVRGSSPEAESS
ncbi:universal stress protein [Halorussus amylolyticus]|uniref:universal stress protein n=1 Tax=Halorussus amylolyticus TaxID=1126242 RepID=UPI0010487B62|nr:universal stress protein [Halorussus amylolyticus]